MLCKEGIWVDALALTGTAPQDPHVAKLEPGALLEDLRGLDPAFDRWIADEKERLTGIARAIGEAMLAECRDDAETAEAAESLLRIDRSHEGAWQALIAVHINRGDRTAASAAFERCRAALAECAQLAPSPETIELAGRIKILGSPLHGRQSALPGMPAGGTPRSSRGEIGRIRLGIAPLRSPNLRGDAGLVGGLAQEITYALTRFRWITCVAISGTPGTDLDQAVYSRRDIDFLLDGGVQLGDGRVRIILRLADLRSGGEVIWAHRFDRELVDVLSLQDEIASETVAQIDLELLLHEGRQAGFRRISRPGAHELVLRAIPGVYRLEQSSFRSAGDMLEDAIAQDPPNAAAHAWLAYWHLFLVGQGWASDPTGATSRAAELAERAVMLDPSDARVLTLAGHVRGFLGKHAQEARTLHERAIALNPNLPLAWCFSGLAHTYLGNHQEAIRRMHQAQRLSPQDPHGFFFDMAMIMPYLLCGEYESAVAIGRQAIELNPGFSSSYKGHLAALGHLGRHQEARELRSRLLALEPGFNVSTAIARSPIARPEDLARYAEGLRRAGLPE